MQKNNHHRYINWRTLSAGEFSAQSHRPWWRGRGMLDTRRGSGRCHLFLDWVFYWRMFPRLLRTWSWSHRAVTLVATPPPPATPPQPSCPLTSYTSLTLVLVYATPHYLKLVQNLIIKPKFSFKNLEASRSKSKPSTN